MLYGLKGKEETKKKTCSKELRGNDKTVTRSEWTIKSTLMKDNVKI